MFSPFDSLEVEEQPSEEKEVEEQPSEEKEVEEQPSAEVTPTLADTVEVKGIDVEHFDASYLAKAAETEEQRGRSRSRSPRRSPRRRDRDGDESDADSERTLTPPGMTSVRRSKWAWESSGQGTPEGGTHRLTESLLSAHGARDDVVEPKARTRAEVEHPASALSTVMGPLCLKCQYPCDAMKAILKHKASPTAHAKYICRPCNNVQTMMNRKVKLEGTMSIGSWSKERQLDFWRKASKSGEDGRLNYGAIRGLIKEQLIEQSLRSPRRLLSLSTCLWKSGARKATTSRWWPIIMTKTGIQLRAGATLSPSSQSHGSTWRNKSKANSWTLKELSVIRHLSSAWKKKTQKMLCLSSKFCLRLLLLFS